MHRKGVNRCRQYSSAWTVWPHGRRTKRSSSLYARVQPIHRERPSLSAVAMIKYVLDEQGGDMGSVVNVG